MAHVTYDCGHRSNSVSRKVARWLTVSGSGWCRACKEHRRIVHGIWK